MGIIKFNSPHIYKDLHEKSAQIYYIIFPNIFIYKTVFKKRMGQMSITAYLGYLCYNPLLLRTSRITLKGFISSWLTSVIREEICGSSKNLLDVLLWSRYKKEAHFSIIGSRRNVFSHGELRGQTSKPRVCLICYHGFIKWYERWNEYEFLQWRLFLQFHFTWWKSPSINN